MRLEAGALLPPARQVLWTQNKLGMHSSVTSCTCSLFLAPSELGMRSPASPWEKNFTESVHGPRNVEDHCFRKQNGVRTISICLTQSFLISQPNLIPHRENATYYTCTKGGLKTRTLFIDEVSEGTFQLWVWRAIDLFLATWVIPPPHNSFTYVHILLFFFEQV